jgi:8-oxo-dGTP diphosphatase
MHMPESPPLHVVAAVIIHEGKILGCRRASHKDAAGLWEFPGGKVESGESPQEALRREISEELSLTVAPWRMLDKSVTQVNEALTIQLECWVIILDQLPVLESSDHDEFVWLRPEELSRYSWAKPDLPAVKKLCAHSDLETLWPILSDSGPSLD